MARPPVKISARGAALDARAFVKSILEGGSSGQVGDEGFDLDARIASVTGSNKQAITNMELTASRRGGETRLKPARKNWRRRGDGDWKRRGNEDLGVGRGRASPFRQSLFASRRGRSQSASPISWRSERRRGHAYQFRPARRTGISPAGQRCAAAHVGRASRPVDAARVTFEKMTATFERSPGELAI